MRHHPTCAREVTRHADDSSAYLSERCTCGATLLEPVTRVEVITEEGRVFTRWNANVELSYQDAGRTLKVFVRSGDVAQTGEPQLFKPQDAASNAVVPTTLSELITRYRQQAEEARVTMDVTYYPDTRETLWLLARERDGFVKALEALVQPEPPDLRPWLKHAPECNAAAWEQRKAAGQLPNYSRPDCTCGLDIVLPPDKPCPHCNGTGTRMYAREVSDGCDTCNASGKVPVETPAKTWDSSMWADTSKHRDVTMQNGSLTSLTMGAERAEFIPPIPVHAGERLDSQSVDGFAVILLNGRVIRVAPYQPLTPRKKATVAPKKKRARKK